MQVPPHAATHLAGTRGGNRSPAGDLGRHTGRGAPGAQSAGRSVTGRQDVKTETRRQLRAIPTWYLGQRYRSRLEARWAVFFHTLGIVADYECQGFDTDGTGYLPDFLLPGQSLIAEVKPGFDADPDGVRRWIDLVEARGKERGVLLTEMHDGPMPLLLIGPDGHGGRWEDDRATWLTCPHGYHYDVQPYPEVGCAHCPSEGDYWRDGDRIAAAYIAARNYRFGRR